MVLSHMRELDLVSITSLSAAAGLDFLLFPFLKSRQKAWKLYYLYNNVV
jgi:hypothetical protein